MVTSDLLNVDSDDLVRRWGAATKAIARASEAVGRIEWELTRRMEEAGATVLPHPEFDVELKTGSATYDVAKLNPLREIVPPELLATAFMAEHEETTTRLIPDKWDMRKALTFRKLGNDVAAIIEAAKVPGRVRLQIKAKEQAPSV